MATQVRRQDVIAKLDEITASGQTFAVECERRTDLFLRYVPTTQYGQGRLCYEGDCSDIETRELVRTSRNKIVLEAAGTLRWMQLTKPTLEPSKHWVSVGGECGAGDRAERTAKGLYLCKGFYNDKKKADGRVARKDNWRAWALICLRTITKIRAHGQEYVVTD